jgi:hypothetical protein
MNFLKVLNRDSKDLLRPAVAMWMLMPNHCEPCNINAPVRSRFIWVDPEGGVKNKPELSGEPSYITGVDLNDSENLSHNLKRYYKHRRKNAEKETNDRTKARRRRKSDSSSSSSSSSSSRSSSVTVRQEDPRKKAMTPVHKVQGSVPSEEKKRLIYVSDSFEIIYLPKVES